MPCPRCAQDNPSTARFCNAGGARLPAGCPACAHANAPGSRFCSQCGGSLDPGPAPPQFGPPGAYTPHHLVEKILTARPALEGERKQVTVLFADLKGSMELLADRDPEEARQILDPVLERLIEAVHRYEGTVNQVMGDGIMALFGAPVAHEDHAVRACYAALRMQESVSRYGDQTQRSHGVPLQIRVGLNSGEVVVRSIGNDLRMDYTAVGQTTHLAARMEQMARPGSVLLTGDTLRLAEGYVEVRSLGPVPVRGLPDPVPVFELTGRGAARTRLRVAATRGLTRFVGRDAETAALHRALDQVRGGRGQVVALVGEPGIGKSRLVWELTHSHRVEGWRTLEASSVSDGQATPYLPIIDLLRSYLGVGDQDDGRRIREKITGRVLTLDEGLKPILPVLFALLSVQGDDAEWSGLDPAERRRRVSHALRRLVVRESQEQPVLLVLEDLHWTDPDTETILDDLVDSIPTVRMLLLVNYRPEYRHGWGSRGCYSQLRLDPLTPDTADALLEGLVGRESELGPLKSLLIERTQGNPFFLEESLRALVETQVLVGDPGAYRLVGPVHAIKVPATVQALLAARIDRLPPEQKHLLQSAAVIGKDVALPVLQMISDLPEADLRRGLAELQEREFLYKTRLHPDEEYTFKHALTREVAYGSLLHERRRALHARVVDALERLHPDRPADQAVRLAHHAFRGEVWAKALAYLGLTVAETSRASLDAVMGGPESAGQLWWRGEYQRAIAVARRDLAIAADFGNFGLRVVSNCRLGQAHYGLGDYPQATEVFRQVVGILQGDLAREHFGMAGLPSVFARAWLARSLAEQGEFAEGLAAGEAGLAIAEAADHAYTLILAAWGLGELHLAQGDLDRAIPILERGLVLSGVAGVPLLFPFVAAPLGAVYAATGRLTEALSLLERSVERATAMELRAGQALTLGWWGEAEVLAGRLDVAAERAQRAASLAQALGERGGRAHALRLAGEIAARRDPPALERADASYREALGIARDLGMRALAARCRLALGTLLARHGRVGEARGELATAAAELRAMGMALWRTQAEASLAQTS
jgi:class 3 adenylate cyclase/tetratricopeptide (TPR) repeat protein